MTVPSYAIPGAGSLQPEPDRARAWLERELSGPEYRQSLTERLLSWLSDLWVALTQAALGASSLSAGVATVLLLVLLVLAVTLVGRVRREPLPPEADAAVVDDAVPAEQHRAVALEALQAGRTDLAVVAGFRALATQATRRGVVAARPGLTAHELAEVIGRAFPARRDGVDHGAQLFDQVFYGGQLPTVEEARALLDLEREIRTLRPVGAVAAETAAVAAR